MPDEREGHTTELRDENYQPYVVEQDVVGAENVKGGGEWPDPDAQPEAPAPGSDPDEAAAIASHRSGAKAKDSMKATLEADPEAGGSKATPD
jgi:hypothetical protein